MVSPMPVSCRQSRRLVCMPRPHVLEHCDVIERIIEAALVPRGGFMMFNKKNPKSAECFGMKTEKYLFPNLLLILDKELVLRVQTGVLRSSGKTNFTVSNPKYSRNRYFTLAENP